MVGIFVHFALIQCTQWRKSMFMGRNSTGPAFKCADCGKVLEQSTASNHAAKAYYRLKYGKTFLAQREPIETTQALLRKGHQWNPRGTADWKLVTWARIGRTFTGLKARPKKT